MEELKSDLAANLAEAQRLIATGGSTGAHLAQTLWPFLEALVENIEEIDDAVAELVGQQEDYLQPETAAVFAAVIQSSLDLAQELRARALEDATIAGKIAQHDALCEQAIAVLADVTLIPEDDGPDEETADA